MRSKNCTVLISSQALSALKSCVALIVLAFAIPSSTQIRKEPTRVLRTVHDIFALTKAQAAKSFPIELQAVVLYSDPQWGALFVQDKTGPTYIDVHGSTARYASGARIRLEAVTVAGNFGPSLAQAKVTVLGNGVLPPAESRRVDELDAGVAESSRVVTEGVLHPCEGNWNRVCFRVFDGKKMVWIFVPQAESPATLALTGALARVTGIVARHEDDNYKRVAAQLFVESLQDIKVEEPAPADWFASQPKPIGALPGSAADERFVRPVHVRGTVTWASPGRFAILDSSGMVFLGAGKEVVVPVGDTVDAVGFPSHGIFGAELADSSIHRDTVLPNAPLLAPLPLTAREILQQSLNGRRVRLKGRLISQTPDAASFSYKLEDGGQTFIAILPRTQETREMVSLPLDHVLELTGIAVMQPGGGSLKVLIDSPAAMVVQEDKGWLTPRRAAALLGAMLFCVLTPLIWITQLRRTVRSQTALIRTKLENELQLETRYRRLFERNLAAVFTWRADGTIVDCNMAFVRMLGLRSREELLGRSYWDFEVDPVLREQLKRSLPEEALGNRDASLRRDDNVTVHLLKNITPVETPEGTIYETTAIDVTQLRHNQAELQRARDAAIYESLNDPLTGLPNRRLLLDTLSAMVARIRAEGGMIALLYIDLDGFKLVNDSLGHRVGDAMLVQMAACLRSWVREGDMLARLGGDEFMVILDRIHTRDDATQVAKDLLHAISSPVRIEGHVLALGASIGISIFPDNAQDAEELMQEADSAMYAAKREGKNRVMHYTPAMGVLVQERLSLENLLRGAIAREEIFLHFQPEFGVADHRLTRFEALARWTHPTLGSIPPLKFIPIAEESGMIDALGAYIMEQACLEAVRWQPQLPYSVQIAVNVSSIQFRRKGFVEEVFAILERTGLKPELLQIELTESVMLSGSSDTADIMNRLRDRGISLAIDDFGTGYSNLSYLPSLPFDFLKIDASFVRNMNAESESESMIKTLVVLAHNFGMRVIVEGVERADQLELIKGFGANEAQGYFLGRPNASPMDVLLPPEVT